MDNGTRTLFASFKLTLLKDSRYGRALSKGNVALNLTVVGINLHKLRAVLRSARAKAVKTEGIFICGFAVVIVVFTARVKLTVNKVPVPSLLLFVISERNAAAVVVDRDGVVGVENSENLVAVTLSCLVNRV